MQVTDDGGHCKISYMQLEVLLMRFAVLIIFSLCPFAVHADTSADRLAKCRTISELATIVMTDRQNGMLATDAMEKGAHDQFPQFSQLHTDLVVGAYKRPMYQSTEYKESAINEFANAAWSECIAFE